MFIEDSSSFIPLIEYLSEFSAISDYFGFILTGTNGLPSFISESVYNSLKEDQESYLLDKYPCLSLIPADLQGEHLAFLRAIAVRMAMQAIKIPSLEENFGLNIKQVKIGPVTEVHDKNRTDEFQRYLFSAYKTQLRKIECIRVNMVPTLGHSVQSYRANQEDDGEIIFTSRNTSSNVNV